LNRGRAEYGGGHEVTGRITIEIDGDTGNEIRFGDGRIDRYTTDKTASHLRVYLAKFHPNLEQLAATRRLRR
jgi:hypothetical protein